MVVSKRTRYEVLRRDNHTCRYCGAAAPDVTLTVDHVTPVTLGGGDDPTNLVAACQDCNAGKSSMSADAPLIDDVAQDALRWSSAMSEAAKVMGANRDRLIEYVNAFDDAWMEYSWGRLPRDHESSIEALYNAGLPADELIDAVLVAATKTGVDNRFRYFCGVAWRKIRDLQDIARGLLEVEKEAESGSDSER